MSLSPRLSSPPLPFYVGGPVPSHFEESDLEAFLKLACYFHHPLSIR